MLSSLPLQVLFYFNGWYDVLYTILMVILFIWKGNWLPYGSAVRPIYGIEFTLIFVVALLEYGRLFLGSKGNKTERAGPLIWSLALSLASLVAFIYYVRLQVYVTRADVILNSIQLGFVALEVLLGLLTVFTFVKAPRATSA